MIGRVIDAVKKKIDGRIPAEVDAKVEQTIRETCNEWGYSEWGYSLDWIKRQIAISWFLNRRYFRTTVSGLSNIPEGRFMLVGNHSGQFAYDGMLIGTVMLMNADPPRFVHAMVGDFFSYAPFYADLMPRLGQVTGAYENCVKLLNEDRGVMVFPEGENAGGKVFFDRYKLYKFGLGFMKIALETRTPIVPFGFIGGEEMVVSFSRMEPLAKIAGMPYLPLSPTGIIPMPVKCSVYFGNPMLFKDDPFDDDVVENNVERVKSEIRNLIDKGLKSRKSIF